MSYGENIIDRVTYLKDETAKKASDFLHDELTSFHSELVIGTPHLEEFIIDAMVNYSEQQVRLNNQIIK